MGNPVYGRFSLIIGSIVGFFIAIVLWLTRKGGLKGKSIALHDFKRFHQHHPKHTVYHPSGMCNALYENHRRHPDRYQGSYRAISYLYRSILARLLETSLLEVGGGIIEAAQSMGATTFQIIVHFVLPEAFASVILALTTGTIALIGATAMAGYIGGGGIGNIALTYGYQTFNFPLMFATVFILIAFVWIIQSLGNRLSQKRRTHQ